VTNGGQENWGVQSTFSGWIFFLSGIDNDEEKLYFVVIKTFSRGYNEYV